VIGRPRYTQANSGILPWSDHNSLFTDPSQIIHHLTIRRYMAHLVSVSWNDPSPLPRGKPVSVPEYPRKQTANHSAAMYPFQSQFTIHAEFRFSLRAKWLLQRNLILNIQYIRFSLRAKWLFQRNLILKYSIYPFLVAC
jgi:hypothetical protein